MRLLLKTTNNIFLVKKKSKNKKYTNSYIWWCHVCLHLPLNIRTYLLLFGPLIQTRVPFNIKLNFSFLVCIFMGFAVAIITDAKLLLFLHFYFIALIYIIVICNSMENSTSTYVEIVFFVLYYECILILRNFIMNLTVNKTNLVYCYQMMTLHF